MTTALPPRLTPAQRTARDSLVTACEQSGEREAADLVRVHAGVQAAGAPDEDDLAAGLDGHVLGVRELRRRDAGRAEARDQAAIGVQAHELNVAGGHTGPPIC